MTTSRRTIVKRPPRRWCHLKFDSLWWLLYAPRQFIHLCFDKLYALCRILYCFFFSSRTSFIAIHVWFLHTYVTTWCQAWRCGCFGQYCGNFEDYFTHVIVRTQCLPRGMITCLWICCVVWLQFGITILASRYGHMKHLETIHISWLNNTFLILKGRQRQVNVVINDGTLHALLQPHL